MRRFFVPGGPTGGEALLRGQEREHLARVLRLRPGDEVVLFDGRGREWLARVAAVEPEVVRLAVVFERQAGAERTLELWLAQALIKGNRADWLVQKACELGVSQLSFVTSERAVARPRDRKARVERWRRICTAALKQCRGCVLPRIELLELDELLARPLEGPRLILHEAEGPPGLSQALEEAGRLERVQVLVGPEGGFTEGEVARATGAGFVTVRLGSRVLRAETAALAAVSALLYAAGELG